MLNHKIHRGCKDEEKISTTDVLASLLGGSPLDSFMEQTRRILLVGEIDELMATSINTQLQYFATTKKPVYIYISSPGGNLTDGYAIIDQMELSPFPIYTIVRGQAHSMAAIIAAYGTKGCRYITPHSSMMLHSVMLELSSDSIERQQEAFLFAQDSYKKLVKELASHARLDIKRLDELLTQTRWMSAKQTIQLGIIDKIWTPQMECKVNQLAVEGNN